MACASIPSSFSHLGASPDGIVQCTCCGKGVLEIKCPYNARECTISDAVHENLIDCLEKTPCGFSLKHSHSYYYQIHTNSSYVKQHMLTWLFGQPKIVSLKESFQNMTCIPLVAESYGAWGSEAVQAFSRLASYLATRTNSPKSKVVCSLYGRLNLTLVRANARALLLRGGCSLQKGDISSS